MQLEQIKPDLYVPTDFGKHHHYYADEKGDKEYTGITSVIGVLAKPALIGWAARMACEYAEPKVVELYQEAPEEDVLIAKLADIFQEAKNAHTKKKEAAGTHGTDAHAAVEDWINLCLKTDGKPNPFLPHESPIAPFVNWSVENVDHFLFSERRMREPDLFIAGTADFAYVGKDGKRYMADFKTSSGIYGIEYWLQVAAYKMLAEGEGDDPYDGMTVVRLGKDGKFEVQKLFDYETYKAAFLACLTIYRAQKSSKDVVLKGE